MIIVKEKKSEDLTGKRENSDSNQFIQIQNNYLEESNDYDIRFNNS